MPNKWFYSDLTAKEQSAVLDEVERRFDELVPICKETFGHGKLSDAEYLTLVNGWARAKNSTLLEMFAHYCFSIYNPICYEIAGKKYERLD